MKRTAADNTLADVQDLGIQPRTVEEVIPTYIGPGRQDFADRSSQIDDHAPSSFAVEDFGRQGALMEDHHGEKPGNEAEDRSFTSCIAVSLASWRCRVMLTGFRSVLE